uniref:conjugal transfer protein n=1 Tax=Candidatus Enterococcus willemsii TaxID=1857215 RepID=UPI00403F1E72
MKIHIERKPKKDKQPKKAKTMHVGTHKKSVLFLWVLLLSSLAFGIYKNFTAIDTHTVHEKTTIETELVDTSAIESFTRNFVYTFYAWENNKEALEQRPERIQHYLTPELQELNSETIRTNIPTSATVTGVQLWQIEALDETNYSVVYTVQQEIKEGKETKQISSTFRITVHQDKDKNLVITTNPTIWKKPTQSNFQPEQPTNDSTIKETTQKEIVTFLETFFQLYPTASKSELNYYVAKDVLPLIDTDLTFSNLLDPVIQKQDGHYIVHVAVKYLDPVTKSDIIAQYQFVLTKEDNWKIIQYGIL